jgi:leucyl/phenylalanyl-tRNA---protein transferase
MDVGDNRDRRESDDPLESLGVLVLWDCDPDDLAPGRRERGDLRRRRLDVMRLGEGHRLHDNGRAAADGHPADVYLDFACHALDCMGGARPDAIEHDVGVPVVPEPSRWALQPAPDDHPSDLWALGADLAPETLLTAYPLALFPMHVDGQLGWFSPRERGVVPLGQFAPSRSLQRAARRYEIRVDTAFEDVMRACGDPARPYGWIDEGYVDAYCELHRLGWAHSVEAWDAAGLAGGLYGVSIRGLFAAESMFFTRSDASKAAFVGLVELLRAAGSPDRRLLDVQWLTPHLERLGAVAIERGEYHRRLRAALTLDGPSLS